MQICISAPKQQKGDLLVKSAQAQGTEMENHGTGHGGAKLADPDERETVSPFLDGQRKHKSVQHPVNFCASSR